VNKVTTGAKGVPLPVWTKIMKDFAIKVMDELKKNNWELSILLCDDKTITDLNKQFRGKNEATDVLSFNLGETIKEGRKSVFIAGDIVISLDTLKENSQYFKISQDEELRRLIIHGILHIDGMEHKTNDKSEPMLVLQENILDMLKNEVIIGEKE